MSTWHTECLSGGAIFTDYLGEGRPAFQSRAELLNHIVHGTMPPSEISSGIQLARYIAYTH
jgi:hypothetical protein